MTAVEESSKLQSSPKGKNTFKCGFSEKNLDKHWTGGKSNHSKEYPDLSKDEYAKRALELIQKPVGKNIEGYANASGQIVRYDKENNDFVKGHPQKGIATMFKPKRKLDYFLDKMKEEGIEEYEN